MNLSKIYYLGNGRAVGFEFAVSEKTGRIHNANLTYYDENMPDGKLIPLALELDDVTRTELATAALDGMYDAGFKVTGRVGTLFRIWLESEIDRELWPIDGRMQ